MNIFRRMLNVLLGRKPEKKIPNSARADGFNELLKKCEESPFPRPVSVTMKATQTIRPDPMAAAVARAKADAKKTAVKGSVSSSRASATSRPADPLMDPLNPLSPLYVGAIDDPRHHRSHHVDTSTLGDSVRSSVASHSEPVRSHSSHTSSHSSHDYSSSHSSHSSHDSGSYDSGSSYSSCD